MGEKSVVKIPESRSILCWITESPPKKNRMGTSHEELRNFEYDQHRIPSPRSELDLLMEHLEIWNMITKEYPFPRLKFLMEEFVWWTGAWRLPLYPPRIPVSFHWRRRAKFRHQQNGFYNIPSEYLVTKAV